MLDTDELYYDLIYSKARCIRRFFKVFDLIMFSYVIRQILYN